MAKNLQHKQAHVKAGRTVRKRRRYAGPQSTYIYLEYTTVSVPSSELGPSSAPLPLASVTHLPPQNQRGGHTRLGVRGGGVVCTLSTLWYGSSITVQISLL
jgi:hypothetical protein